MSPKDIIGVAKELFGSATKAVGAAVIVLFLMSLYPPLSFIPKFVLLFALTH